MPGASPDPVRLERDYSAKADRNMHVSLLTIPEQPTVGNRTQMRFTLDDGGAARSISARGDTCSPRATT